MDIMQDVIGRLADLGFDVISEQPALVYAIEYTRETILNDINRDEIPEGLKMTFIDMSCGNYLKNMKATGQIDISSSGKVSSITEGDVTVSFDNGSSGDTSFDSLIQTLLTPRYVARYRRLVW